MQGEDDLRGLAKIMAFMRAVSILLVLMHLYWFCYGFFLERGWTLEVINKILGNFDRTAGLFSHSLYTKVFALVLLALSCLGTKGVKNERITWPKIYVALSIGFVLFFLNTLLLKLSPAVGTFLYILTISLGYIAFLMAGVWMSRLLRTNLMDDVFNNENESFQQETKLMENEYSVNLPTKFYYKGKWNNGWINIVNPFRASIVLGTPGSGKSYAIVNNYIKQQIEKGFSMYIYDFKFDDLSTIAYNHLLKHRDKYKVQPKFYVINFDDPRKSHRCNPLNPDFMTDISDAYEAAYTIMLNLNRSWIQKQGDFFVESPIILLAAIIWYLKIYENGKYCTFPHAIELLNKKYSDVFTILTSYPDLENYLSPFMDAMESFITERGIEGDMGAKDQYMAESIDWFLKNSLGKKIILVAHNAHIQKTPVDFDGFISCYPMGQRLSMTFGEKYKAFAITNLRGETAALYPDNDYQFGFRVDKFPLDFPESDSVEFIMQEFGGKECCLLMNRSTELKNCNKIRFDSMCLKTEIEEAFDGIFLIEKSTVSEVVD